MCLTPIIQIVENTIHQLKTGIMALLLLLIVGLQACNSKSDDYSWDDFEIVTASSVAIKEFKLTADSKVMANLDSVFFSIDLNKAVVFNADSLPLGTAVNKLIPAITFAGSPSKALIIIDKESEPADTVDYLLNATDSIDFTRKVTLRVTSPDGKKELDYLIKVNVHTQKPDSLTWDELATTPLPSRAASPKAQKTLEFDNAILCFSEEADGSYTLSQCTKLFDPSWSKQEITLPEGAQLRTMTATSSSLFILDANGKLYASADGLVWELADSSWVTIIGEYDDAILGVKSDDSGLSFCHYPASANITDPAFIASFPLEGRTNLLTITSKWSSSPMAFFAGGINSDGSLSSSIWAFDGKSWVITGSGIPAVADAVIFPFTARVGATNFKPGTEYSAWYLMGGRTSDGFNRSTYISLNNGVNWSVGGSLTDLPEEFPSFANADVIVEDHTLNAELSNLWKPVTTKARSLSLTRSYILDGYDISWECPYIFLCGGIDKDGLLIPTIRRGTIARLTFTPII